MVLDSATELHGIFQFLNFENESEDDSDQIVAKILKKKEFSVDLTYRPILHNKYNIDDDQIKNDIHKLNIEGNNVKEINIKGVKEIKIEGVKKDQEVYLKNRFGRIQFLYFQREYKNCLAMCDIDICHFHSSRNDTAPIDSLVKENEQVSFHHPFSNELIDTAIRCCLKLGFIERAIELIPLLSHTFSKDPPMLILHAQIYLLSNNGSELELGLKKMIDFMTVRKNDYRGWMLLKKFLKRKNMSQWALVCDALSLLYHPFKTTSSFKLDEYDFENFVGEAGLETILLPNLIRLLESEFLKVCLKSSSRK